MKTKKSCCKDRPRCGRCPVVWKRLETAGHAKRTGKHKIRVADRVPKAAMADARAR